MCCFFFFVFFLMMRRPPRSTLDRSSAASDVYKRQESVSAYQSEWEKKAQISFKEMIKQFGGLSSSKASMVPDMLISGHPCPWDYNGNFVFYASSRLSLIHISEPTRPY